MDVDVDYLPVNGARKQLRNHRFRHSVWAGAKYLAGSISAPGGYNDNTHTYAGTA